MKKLIALLVGVLFTTLTFAQLTDGITVCHTPAIEKFALFASNKDFNLEHLKPRAYVHRSTEGGTTITFKCPDGTSATGYVIKAKTQTDNWIFVFQEWWGLNDNIKRQAEKLYKDLGNVNVLALDMYDGKVTAVREEASKLMSEFKFERGSQIIGGAQSYAGPKAKIGTIGWCFGGSVSIQAALGLEKQTVACVIFYGMPETDVEKLKTLNSDVLGIFATKDKYITGEVVTKFAENMKAAGKTLILKNYEADHGFANPSNPIYDQTADIDAWNNTIEFFKARLK
jgi:carboxymethylenebutenolidase